MIILLIFNAMNSSMYVMGKNKFVSFAFPNRTNSISNCIIGGGTIDMSKSVKSKCSRLFGFLSEHFPINDEIPTLTCEPYEIVT